MEAQNKERVLVSISGGETSAMMAYLINKHYDEKYEIIYVFANTSREREETLIFLEDIRRHWGLNVVWVEAVVHHGEKRSSTHRVVDFTTAKRKGEVFREVIKKYGIPNKSFPHCTRELKTRPIESYAKSIGWNKGSYRIAIGYRSDEMRRVKWSKETTDGHWYLLPRLHIAKPEVKAFFARQSFILGLKEHEGNCKLCYKKSKRKLLTQIAEDPECVEWVNEMEIEFGNYVTGRRDEIEPMPFRFFREYESVVDLVEESRMAFDRFVERTNLQAMLDFDAGMDYEDECAESCEPFK